MTRTLSGAALAVTAVLAAAGCTAGVPATGAASQAGTAPAITAGQARQVFDSYVTTSEEAARTGDRALALSDVTGVQWADVSATFKSDRYFRVPAPYSGYTYGTPVFYLPGRSGYPREFVVAVPRELAGYQAGSSNAGVMATWLGGAELPVDGTVLLVFQQTAATAPWQLASTSQLATGMSVPRLTTDGGRVRQLAMSQDALLSSPEVVGPLQAAIVDDGPASPAAQVVASGPLTTGLYTTSRAAGLGLSAPPGDVRQWQLDGSNYAKFALQTAGGGALVFYSMYLDTTVAVPAELDQSDQVNPGPPITVPDYLRPLLPAGTKSPRVMLEGQELLSFAAVDPPAGSGKIQVIAIGGGPTYASAS